MFCLNSMLKVVKNDMKGVKNMFQINKDIFKDIWTIFISTLSLGFAFTLMGLMMKPSNPNDVFLLFFGWSLLSFGAAWLLVQVVKRIFYIKNSFSNWSFSISWLVIIFLGCFFFTCFFEKTFLISFGTFMAILSIAMIPSIIFRIVIKFINSYWEGKQESKISIIN